MSYRTHKTWTGLKRDTLFEINWIRSLFHKRKFFTVDQWIQCQYISNAAHMCFKYCALQNDRQLANNFNLLQVNISWPLYFLRVTSLLVIFSYLFVYFRRIIGNEWSFIVFRTVHLVNIQSKTNESDDNKVTNTKTYANFWYFLTWLWN